jgi:hypothetical protein
MTYLYNLPGQVVIDPDTKDEWLVDSVGDGYVCLVKRRTVQNNAMKLWKVKKEKVCNCTCCCSTSKG